MNTPSTTLFPVSQTRHQYSILTAMREVAHTGNLKGKPTSWLSNPHIAAAAIRRNPFALRDTKLRGNRQIVELAVSINGLALNWANAELQEDPKLKQLAAKTTPKYFPQKRLPPPMQWRLSIGRPCPYYFHKSMAKSLPPFLEQAQFLESAKKENSIFLRDSSVTLFEKMRLLPSPNGENYSVEELGASLPPSASHFLCFEKDGTTEISHIEMAGKGFYKTNIDQAMINAIDNQIPFKQAKTCIEGGNCFLFFSKGERKAVIGEISLYLSMMTLEKSSHFRKPIWPKKNAQPTETALRIARNRDLYALHQESPVEDDTYWASLIKPLTPEERQQYHLIALIIDRKLAMTKQVIAEDLNVHQDNIAFVPQSDFHIDLELLVTPQGEVILQSDTKSLQVLSELEETNQLDEAQAALLDTYKRESKEQIALRNPVLEGQRKALKKARIPFRELPLNFASPEKSVLNHSNGIFLPLRCNASLGCPPGFSQTHVFVTTGPSSPEEAIFHGKIQTIFEAALPKYRLHGVEGVSKFLAKSGGGIRCLSFEDRIICEP